MITQSDIDAAEAHIDGEPCDCSHCNESRDAGMAAAAETYVPGCAQNATDEQRMEAHFVAHGCRDYDGCHWQQCDCPTCEESKRVARAEMATDIEREDAEN